METTATGILCQFHERVADRIGSNHFRAWFQPPTQLALDAERVCVVVPNSFIGNWIASNYARHLADAARALTGAEMRVEITVQATSPAGRPPVPPAAPPRNVATAAAPRPGPRRPQSVVLRGELETYVVGAGNALAFAAAERIVRSPNRAHSPIVMHGGCGLGKTHLLHGICNGVRRGHPELHWCYISGEEFTNEYIYALKAGRVDQFRARFRNVDLLVIDDIHFLQNKKATQEEFLHTLNAIDTGGRAVVLSTDRHPREIATLTEHLISRLVAGIVVEIAPPDFATRREILRRRAADADFRVPPEAVEVLARHITRNVRELEGGLYKLIALASLNRDRPLLDLAREVVADHNGRARRAPEAGEIERLVAEYFGVMLEALRGRTRAHTVCAARGVAMYLMRKHTRLSSPEIGRQLGGKNHSTVLAAIRRVEDTLKRNGVVGWKTSSGDKEVRLSEVLQFLEGELGPKPGEPPSLPQS